MNRELTHAGTRAVLISILTTVLLFNFFATVILPAHAAASIELEEFRWNKFPITVYVDLNRWSVPDYAVAIREALDNWLKAIWNYTNAYGGQSLTMISYTYYVKNANSTSNPDVIMSFTPNKMGFNAVGLTTCKYEPSSHEPIAPTNINITTYSATASDLFVKDVAMHEFGHALGVAHATLPNTENGPELMYRASSETEIVFPSTLDVYALTQLYRGGFSQTIQLPTSIPYLMLPEGSIPPPQTPLWQTYIKYVPLIAAAVIVLVIGLVIAAFAIRMKAGEILPSRPPPQPPDGIFSLV